MITDLGDVNTSLKVLSLIPSATPNVTKARMMFTINIPPSPKLMVIPFRASNCSFITNKHQAADLSATFMVSHYVGLRQ
jgi:hypothetical protein